MANTKSGESTSKKRSATGSPAASKKPTTVAKRAKLSEGARKRVEVHVTKSTIPMLVKSAIDEFDAGKLDFESIKENMLSYSAINMLFGKLRPQTPPAILVEVAGAVNPADAEQQDRRRQLEANAPQPDTSESNSDSEAAARLVALHDEECGYVPFDFKQNITNALYAIVAITGYLPAVESFKESYISSLNAIQNTSIPCRESVVLSFDNPTLLNELWREGLITPDARHLFSPLERERIVHHIADAFAFIKAVDVNLHDAIQAMIGTIACIRREGSSGTVSSMIGLLWLNPDPSWTIVDYAENIVHEFIHNTIFLADLIWKIFTKPHWYAPEEGLVVSAIKKYPRGVNIAYHSAFVAIGLSIFMKKAQQHARAEELALGLRETISGLKEKSETFLSPYAVEALNRVDIYGSLSA